MPYDIYWNQSTYSTVFLLLDKWHRTNHCFIVCGKWIVYSNFEVVFPLTHDFLNYVFCGDDTDKIKFVDVLHEISAVPSEVVQIGLNMK